MDIINADVGDLNNENTIEKNFGFCRNDLIFPIDEFRERLERIRTKIKSQGLNAIMVTTPENIFYLTGYQTLGYWYFQALIIPEDDFPFMVLRALEEPNVAARTYLTESFIYEDNESPIDCLHKALKKKGLLKSKIGVEYHSYFIRNSEMTEIKNKMPNILFSDCYGWIEDMRVVKSDLEIEKMKKAGLFTQMGMQKALDEVEVGKTENNVASAFYEGALIAGSHYMAMPPFVAAGPRSYLPHATFMNRTIEPQEFVLLEGAGCFQRYHVPCMRTIYMGQPDDWFLEIEKILSDALTATIKAMKPGVTAADVDKINQEYIQKNDFGGVQNSRTGYSIGTSFAPDWGEGHIISLIKDNDVVLKENMCFHVLSYIQIPSSSNSKESRFGLTDSVYVTPEGGVSLVNLPYKIKFG